MPGGVSAGFGNHNLDAVNKLREYWHKGQTAIVIDDHVSMTNYVFHLCLSNFNRFILVLLILICYLVINLCINV